jgi:hypothetical protein
MGVRGEPVDSDDPLTLTARLHRSALAFPLRKPAQASLSAVDIQNSTTMRAANIWVAVICGVATCAWGQADADPTVRSKLTTLEQIWGRALSNGDVKALDALSDPSLVYVDSDGSLLSKADLLIYSKTPHPQRSIVTFTKVQVFDDTAVINGTYRSKESKNGRTVVQEGQFTDTWLYRDSAWVCIAAQQTPVLHAN